MFIYLAETETNNTNSEHSIKIKTELTEEDLNELNCCFKYIGIYNTLTNIKDIVVENGLEFIKWMQSANLKQQYNKKVKINKIVLTANKLILNYASSLKTFVDIENRLITKYKLDIIKDYNQLLNDYYDNHIEYRFWMNFRNFVVHCNFPLTKYSAKLDGEHKIICSKEHLLTFNNWKKSKSDIQLMSDEIELTKLVTPMSVLIYSLYLEFFFYFAQDILDAVNNYCSFCKKHNVTTPIIIKTEKKNEYSNGKLQPLSVNELFKYLKILRIHPNVNITNKR